jgi:hypothetical protein
MRKFIYLLGLVLSMGAGLVLADTDTPEKASVEAVSEVRQPEGDVEAFWNDIEWNEMTTTEQTLWQTLGWQTASWQGEAEKPASEGKDWQDLTDEERAAATQLGYDQAAWDAE